MVKKADDSFELTVPLPAETDKVLYKYVVDGEWLTSSSEKTTKDDAGIENNFLEGGDLVSAKSTGAAIPEAGGLAAAVKSNDVKTTVMPKEEAKQTTLGEPGIHVPQDPESLKAFETVRNVDPKSLNEPEPEVAEAPLSAAEKKKQKKKVKRNQYKAKKKKKATEGEGAVAGATEESTEESKEESAEPESKPGIVDAAIAGTAGAVAAAGAATAAGAAGIANAYSASEPKAEIPESKSEIPEPQVEAAKEPVAEEVPVASETKADTSNGEIPEPTVDEPKVEEPVVPAVEEPKTEEVKEPVAAAVTEPKAEEPKAEEPKAEEPVVEEPKTEEKTEEPEVAAPVAAAVGGAAVGENAKAEPKAEDAKDAAYHSLDPNADGKELPVDKSEEKPNYKSDDEIVVAQGEGKDVEAQIIAAEKGEVTLEEIQPTESEKAKLTEEANMSRPSSKPSEKSIKEASKSPKKEEKKPVAKKETKKEEKDGKKKKGGFLGKLKKIFS